jgi:hypothetical protein
MAYIITINISIPGYFEKDNLILKKAFIRIDSGGTYIYTDLVDPTYITDAQYNTCLIGKRFRGYIEGQYANIRRYSTRSYHCYYHNYRY